MADSFLVIQDPWSFLLLVAYFGRGSIKCPSSEHEETQKLQKLGSLIQYAPWDETRLLNDLPQRTNHTFSVEDLHDLTANTFQLEYAPKPG